MRVFIAIPLPAETLEVLSQMQQTLRATGTDVRWTAPGSIHLTLKFLGEIDHGLLDRLVPSLRSAISLLDSFSLTVRGIGAFPNERAPRIAWCGIGGDLDGLQLVQTATEQVCGRLGMASEDRPFRSHLTLGRVKGKRNLHSLLERIKIGSNLENTFHAAQINIYKSTLTSRGSLYDVLESLYMKAAS